MKFKEGVTLVEHGNNRNRSGMEKNQEMHSMVWILREFYWRPPPKQPDDPPAVLCQQAWHLQKYGGRRRRLWAAISVHIPFLQYKYYKYKYYSHIVIPKVQWFCMLPITSKSFRRGFKQSPIWTFESSCQVIISYFIEACPFLFRIIISWLRYCCTLHCLL